MACFFSFNTFRLTRRVTVQVWSFWHSKRLLHSFWGLGWSSNHLYQTAIRQSQNGWGKTVLQSVVSWENQLWNISSTCGILQKVSIILNQWPHASKQKKKMYPLSSNCYEQFDYYWLIFSCSLWTYNKKILCFRVLWVDIFFSK